MARDSEFRGWLWDAKIRSHTISNFMQRILPLNMSFVISHWVVSMCSIDFLACMINLNNNIYSTVFKCLGIFQALDRALCILCMLRHANTWLTVEISICWNSGYNEWEQYGNFWDNCDSQNVFIQSVSLCYLYLKVELKLQDFTAYRLDQIVI